MQKNANICKITRVTIAGIDQDGNASEQNMPPQEALDFLNEQFSDDATPENFPRYNENPLGVRNLLLGNPVMLDSLRAGVKSIRNTHTSHAAMANEMYDVVKEGVSEQYLSRCSANIAAYVIRDFEKGSVPNNRGSLFLIHAYVWLMNIEYRIRWDKHSTLLRELG